MHYVTLAYDVVCSLIRKLQTTCSLKLSLKTHSNTTSHILHQYFLNAWYVFRQRLPVDTHTAVIVDLPLRLGSVTWSYLYAMTFCTLKISYYWISLINSAIYLSTCIIGTLTIDYFYAARNKLFLYCPKGQAFSSLFGPYFLESIKDPQHELDRILGLNCFLCNAYQRCSDWIPLISARLMCLAFVTHGTRSSSVGYDKKYHL